MYGIAPIEGEADDVVGLGWSYGGLGQTEVDVEGRLRVRLRREDDASGQGWRFSGLDQTDSEDDASGQGGRWGLGQCGDDTRGQVYIRFQKPEPGVP